MTNPSVLVLDSGVGGLSITGEIRTRCPFLHIDYIADLDAFPYGTKSEKQIVERVVSLIAHSIGTLKPSIIVIACNTASTVALNEVRRIVEVPVVGVVPAIKPAAKLSQTGCIGLLATEGTINRTYTHNLIQEFAQNKTVVLHGSARLVELAEEKLRVGSVSLELVKKELFPLFQKASDIDTVVLACTHFPLLKAEFIAAFPEIKFWVDSGTAIANRVHSLFSTHKIYVQAENPLSQLNRLYTTSAKTVYHTLSLEQFLGRFKVEHMVM